MPDLAQQKLPLAIEWVRKNFVKALYSNYKDPDGRPKYLLLEKEELRGFTRYRLISSKALAEFVINVKPDYDKAPVNEVVQALYKTDTERGGRLRSLFKRCFKEVPGV